MHMNTTHSKELLKGTLAAIILNLLAEEGKMYGYQMTRRIKELSDEKILVKEGSLYPALHKLEAEGAVAVETVHIGKRVRRYYRLTPSGKTVQKDKLKEIAAFMDTLTAMLFPNAKNPAL